MQYSSNKKELDEFLEKSEHNNVFYDFDNTLFLDNSTNLYFNTIRPRWLVLIIFSIVNFIFDRFKINRFVWEDYIKTIIGVYLFPIAYLKWKFSTSKYFAKELLNKELLKNNFANGKKLIVISFGHKEIIQPILKHMGIGDYVLISSKVSLIPHNIRKKGKLHYINKYLNQDDKEKALFVTDSKDDRELLEYFHNSFLIVWRKQTPVSFHNIYVPLKYTAGCKYNVKDILWNQHIGEDFIILLFAYSIFMPLDIFALFMLFLSFFAVYEIGYYENDFKAIKNEANPSLSGKQSEYLDYPIYSGGFIWALITSAIGILYFSTDFLVDYLSWLGILIGLFFTFRLFNNLKPDNRIYIFPFLQIFKTFSYTLVLKINPIGMVLLFAQVMRQTTNYHIYRMGGDIRKFKRQNHRLLIFTIVTTILFIIGLINLNDILTIQFLLILLWTLQRSITRDMGGYKTFVNKLFKIPNLLINKLFKNR